MATFTPNDLQKQLYVEVMSNIHPDLEQSAARPQAVHIWLVYHKQTLHALAGLGRAAIHNGRNSPEDMITTYAIALSWLDDNVVFWLGRYECLRKLVDFEAAPESQWQQNFRTLASLDRDL